MKSPPSARAVPVSRPASGTPAAESAAPSRSGSVIRIGLAIWYSMAPAPVTSPGSRTYVASTRPSTGAAISTWQPRSVSSWPSASCWRASRPASGARQPAAAKSPVTAGERSSTRRSGADIDRTPKRGTGLAVLRCFGGAGVQPFADLLGGVGTPAPLGTGDHDSGGGDTCHTGQSQDFPPAHLLRLDHARCEHHP